MGIKTYNPYTPSRRHMTGSDFSEITKKTPEKSLTYSLKKNSGRNNQGKITVRHRGGGAKKKYRLIDFKRNKDGIPAKVVAIEYDPNRTANIALICYVDGQKSYIIAPNKLEVGTTIMNGPDAEIHIGNCLPLENMRLHVWRKMAISHLFRIRTLQPANAVPTTGSPAKGVLTIRKNVRNGCLRRKL